MSDKFSSHKSNYVFTLASGNRGMGRVISGIWLCVCLTLLSLSVCLSVHTLERKTAWAIDTKVGRHNAGQSLGMRWPWDQKINVTRLWDVLPAWYACRYDCLGFLV